MKAARAAVLALVLALLVPAHRANAAIRCSSYRYVGCSPQQCCLFTCVYCVRQETGEVLSLSCYDEVCEDNVI